MGVLNVLKLKGFEPVTTAIYAKFPFQAEVNPMGVEADYAAHHTEYAKEKLSISRGIEECFLEKEAHDG